MQSFVFHKIYKWWSYAIENRIKIHKIHVHFMERKWNCKSNDKIIIFIYIHMHLSMLLIIFNRIMNHHCFCYWYSDGIKKKKNKRSILITVLIDYWWWWANQITIGRYRYFNVYIDDDDYRRRCHILG